MTDLRTIPRSISLDVDRGAGLSLRINDSYVAQTLSAVLAELQRMRPLPEVRIDVNVRCHSDFRSGAPTAGELAHWIAGELEKNEIWDLTRSPV